MRALVTGASGFIGSALVTRLAAAGHEVHSILRPTSDAARLAPLGGKATLHRLLLDDAPAVRACVAAVAPTHLFHLASDTGSRHVSGLDQARVSAGEVTRLLTLVDAAARSPVRPCQLLRTGSIAEYGAAPVPFVETQREQPRNGYAAALVAGTHFAQAIAADLPFPIVTARLALVYGPGQAKGFLVPALIEACMGGEPLVLARPDDRRDLIHLRDAVDALCSLAERPLRGGEVVNVGSGRTVGVAELAAIVAAIAGATSPSITRQPQSDPVTLQLDISRMQALTGWRATTDLLDGLAGIIAGHGHSGMAAAA